MPTQVRAFGVYSSASKLPPPASCTTVPQMTDEKFTQLCAKIATEKDPRKLAEATSELIKLLAEEQDAIKAKISANLGQFANMPE